MINYWYEAFENIGSEQSWTANIMAGSDLLNVLCNYPSKEAIEQAAQTFIDGIKFARGEQ